MLTGVALNTLFPYTLPGIRCLHTACLRPSTAAGLQAPSAGCQKVWLAAAGLCTPKCRWTAWSEG